MSLLGIFSIVFFIIAAVFGVLAAVVPPNDNRIGWLAVASIGAGAACKTLAGV